MVQVCPKCGAENQEDAQVCSQCQASLPNLSSQDAQAGQEAFVSVINDTAENTIYPLGIDLVSGRMTHAGKKRAVNQDSLIVIECGRISQSVGLPIGIYAVADGMGGQAAGEVASKVAVDIVAQKAQLEAILPYLSSGAVPFGDPTSWMTKVTLEANKAVYNLRQEMHNNMGTTLVWALVLEDTAYIANVGDSRAYMINEDGLRKVTQDHSFVEQLVANGRITWEEARVHPHRNVIYRTMGHSLQVEVDVFVEPLMTGDRLLLCSDGLNGMLSDEELRKAARSSSYPRESCANLIDAANAAGGRDNITAILVELVPVSEQV